MHPEEQKSTSLADASSETLATDVDDTKYESPIKPLLWIVVPFVLTLLYGIFAPG